MKKIKPFLHISDLSDEPVKYRIPDLLTMRGNVLISAYRKTGKTTLILHLAAALCNKTTPFLGRPVRATRWKFSVRELRNGAEHAPQVRLRAKH